MAIFWGSFTTGTSNNFRVGIDLSVSGTTITARYYFQSEYNVNDGASLNRSGALTGSHSFQAVSGGGAAVLITTNTLAGNRGQSYSFGASISGLYNGASPSVSGANITVPALPPNTAGKPVISSITASSFIARTSAPANNGAAITSYNWQWIGAISGSTSTPGTQLGPTTGFPSNASLQVRAQAVNAAGAGGWSAYSNAFVTLPAPPAAPGIPTVSRASDTQHTVSWVRNNTAAAPYASQQVQRAVWISSSGGGGGSYGAFVTIANVSGPSSAFSDTTTAANNIYRYRVVATNSAGSAISGQSGAVFTTPTSPTSVQANKNSNDDIVLTWVLRSQTSGNNLTEVQHSSDGGGTWEQLGIFSGGTQAFTHVDPSILTTHLYRVRSYISSSGSVGHGLTSAWVNSNTVQLAAPPNAPTLTGPSGAQDATLPITLTWIHNPVDSSQQRKYQVRYRVQGTATWTDTGEVVSGTQSLTVAAGTWSNGDTIEWQARTWGVHVNASPWSATSTILLSSPPSTTILFPVDGAAHADPSLTVEWAYFDPEGSAQSGWQVELRNSDGTVVETRNGSGPQTTLLLNTSLGDSTSWTVRVRTRDGAQMWSDWTEVTFDVAYPEPLPPIVALEWQPTTGTIEISVENTEPTGGEPEVISNDIYRQIDGGEWELVSVGVPPNSTWVDTTNPVVGEICYYAMAWSALPSASVSDPVCLTIFDGTIECPVDEPSTMSAWISAGSGFGIIERAYLDLRINEPEVGVVDRTLHRFSGRTYPVEFAGLTLGQTVDLTFTTQRGALTRDGQEISIYDEWVALARLKGPHLYRDYQGRRFRCSISPLRVTDLGYGVKQISVTVTRTEEMV